MQESGCVITCAARLDNRPELIHALGLDDLPVNSLSDGDLILRAYRRWSTECAPSLLGDFAFVIWDPARQQMFAARDALGCQDLHYFINQNYVMLATRLNVLLEHPAVQPRLNERKIAEFLAVQWGNDANTYYDSIYHLPPAHCLLVTAESSRLWRYWEVDPGRIIRYPRQEQYAEHYRELIKGSLLGRLRSIRPVGLSLSGGLDSSSLACLAAEVLAETGAPEGRLRSYSYVFDELPNCDEQAYIQPVIQRVASLYTIRPRMIKGDNLWPAPFQQDWLISQDYPFQDPYQYLLQAILQAAHHDGVRVMLSGFSGDDLYSGGDTWFADLLLAGHLRQAAGLLAASARQGDLKWNQLEHNLRAMLPAGFKKFYRRLRPRVPEWAGWIHPGLAGRSGLAGPDTPAFTQPKFRLPGQQNRYSTLFFSGYPDLFAAFQNLARSNGLEYVFPFADRRIVEFMLGLPSEQVALPGLERRVLRDALKGKLPEIVQQRQDKSLLFDLFNKGIYEIGFPDIQKKFLHSQVLERGFIRKDWLTGELERKTSTRDGFTFMAGVKRGDLAAEILVIPNF